MVRLCEQELWHMDDPTIGMLNAFTEAEIPAFGIDIPERLFVEAYIIRQVTAV